ncbi:TPA: TetR/AcrR family transcriptional regulator C-terminal domain-containing protein [Candidatus Ventrenecus stercoripullorum]|nr:TetR/AcrR family transcriptional regulator C-terminal domain-containing protein [Candidatus Ventrenecus stercoripullorum]
MNTPNNKRKRESKQKIEKVFIQLLQTKELNEISVTEICKEAHLNRSTFYANYLDVYDLADKVALDLEQEVFSLYKEERDTKYNSNDFLKLFRHIKENQIFYQTYFKLNKDQNFNGVLLYDTNLSKVFFNDKYVDYHIEFFKAGLNAIIKKWLYNGCKEEPEEIDFIIKEEYKTKNFNF